MDNFLFSLKLKLSNFHYFSINTQCSAEAAFLRHCPTNFENDAAKTVPAGHLAHTDFWPGAGL